MEFIVQDESRQNPLSSLVRKAIAPELRSSLPGRERWKSEVLCGRVPLCTDLEQLLQQTRGVTSAAVNPGLGSILVLFDAGAYPDGFAVVLRESLQSVIFAAVIRSGEAQAVMLEASSASLDELRNGGLEKIAKRVLPPQTRPALTSGWNNGVLLGAAALAAGLILPGAFWVGGVVCVATGLIIKHFWDKSNWANQPNSFGTELQPATPNTDHPMRRLVKTLPHLGPQIRTASLCSIATKIVNMMPSLIIGFALTIVSTGPSALLSSTIGLTTAASQLWFVVGVGAVMWALESYLEYTSGLRWRRIAQQAQHDLRVIGYRHVQQLDTHFLEGEHVGEISAVLNEDVNRLHLFLDAGAHDLLQIVSDLIIAVPLFYLVAPQVAWVAVLPIPLLVWMSFYYEEYTASFYSEARQRSAVVSGQLVSNLEGISVIKSFATEDREVERIQDLSLDYKRSHDVADSYAAGFSPTVRLTMLSAWAGTILVGGYQVFNGVITTGVYGTMISLTLRFLWPLMGMGKTVDDYQRSMAGAVRVFDLLDVPVATGGSGDELTEAQAAGDIRLENVRFSYPGRGSVFEDLSLTIQRGRTTAIVGATGCGKTTVIKLLLRFYEIDGGRIMFDGVDIRHVAVRNLRQAIAVVSQDVFLFEGTIRDNIAYGTFDATDAAIVAAAKQAEIHGFIHGLPDGYDTIVGERGVKLSGGQRQRICMARAIVKDAPVLILDEATSAVDTETEAAIQRALARVRQGRTTLMVAHRLSTIRNADRIYVLGEGGRILEQGSHNELLQREGAYAAMWLSQSGVTTIDVGDSAVWEQ